MVLLMPSYAREAAVEPSYAREAAVESSYAREAAVEPSYAREAAVEPSGARAATPPHRAHRGHIKSWPRWRTTTRGRWWRRSRRWSLARRCSKPDAAYAPAQRHGTRGGGGTGAEAHEEAHEDAHVEALEEHAVAKEESLNRARSGLHPPEEHVAEHEQPRKQLLLRSGRSQRTNARGAHKTAESRDRIAKGHSVDG